MKIAAGDYLFAEGEINDALYIVKSGSLLAVRRDGNRFDVLETFGPGSIIGELPLANISTRPYSVKASENSELERLEKETIEEPIKNMPRWFRSMLRSMLERQTTVHHKKHRYFALRALPALLAALDHFIRTTDSNTLDFENLAQRVQALNGIHPNDTERLCTALAKLELFQFSGTTLFLKQPNVISLLYETLCQRALTKTRAALLLSATEQSLLFQFAQTAAQNGTIFESPFTEITGKDFLKGFAHIRLSRKMFLPLVEKRILYLEPGDSDEFGETDRLYGDLDYIHDLLALNRIYPLLDKKLVEYL